MKKSIKISLLVVILLIGGILLYKLIPNSRLSKEVSSLKIAHAEITFPGGNNKTYTSEKLNLTINYPKEYYLNASESSGRFGIIQVSNFDLNNISDEFAFNNRDKIFKLEIANIANYDNSLSLNDWVKSYNDTMTEEFPDSHKVESTENIKVDSKDVVLQKTNGIYTVFVNINDNIIGLTGYPGGDKFKDLYFNIINSIKFDK